MNNLSKILTPAALKTLEDMRYNLETAICIQDNDYYNKINSRLMTYLDAMSDICEEVIIFDTINNWDSDGDLHLQLKIYFEKKPNDYVIIGEGVIK